MKENKKLTEEENRDINQNETSQINNVKPLNLCGFCSHVIYNKYWDFKPHLKNETIMCNDCLTLIVESHTQFIEKPEYLTCRVCGTQRACKDMLPTKKNRINICYSCIEKVYHYFEGFVRAEGFVKRK